MTGHGCSSLCGFCGGCSADFDRDEWNDSAPIWCAHCDKPLSPLDYKLSMASGTFCSERCADLYEAKFQAQMRQRRRR